MKHIIIILSFVILSGQLSGQSMQIREVKSESYPLIELEVFDRNPSPWRKGAVRILEDNKPLDSVSIVSATSEVRPSKRVFILFENSHFPSFDPQRNYLKAFLSESLKFFSDKDELYFSEFDWTLPNGKVLRPEGIYKGKKDQIEDIVAGIKKPASNGKTHESTELNTAMMEALEYLHEIPDDPQFEKAILLFSSEFSNIYNSIHTPESIILSSRQKNIPIYSVRYPRMAPKYSLAKITESTYGMHYQIDLAKNRTDLVAGFGKVIEQINNRAVGNLYRISYTTAIPPGSKPVTVKIVQSDDPFQPETVLLTPGYVQYVLMDPLRLAVAGAIIFLFIVLILLLVLSQRKKRIKEKQENDRKLQSIKDESRKEIEKQEKQLEKLENDRMAQKEREFVSQREQEKEKAVQASVARFRQMPRIPFLSGQDGGNYPLAVVNLIGRSQQEGCTLVISDSTISRKHAYILFERTSPDQAPQENYSFYLVELGSSNGTFLNEQQVLSPVMLKNGDLIRFGKVNLTFRL
jgi:hypothetical protein